MEGGIPSFTSSLSLLALHQNRLKVLPELHFEDHVATTAIFLHNDLLSCHVPRCGNATASTSILAIGNRLRQPRGKFPAWVSRYEHDPLFWDDGSQGMFLLRLVSGAVLLFLFAMVSKLRSAEW